MSRKIRWMSLAAGLLAAVSLAHAEPSPLAEPYAVFVDRPSGNAYINTNVGWKFIRTLTPAQIEQLHETTLFEVGPQRKVQPQVADVFVDRPSGNAYVYTRSGWHYTRRLDRQGVESLPLSTLTRLVEPAGVPATALATAD